jgi:AP-1 complex subunit gamma-1
LDLLSDIFAVSAAVAPSSGGYDPFSNPTPAQKAPNPMDLFGSPPPMTITPVFGYGAPLAPAPLDSTVDLFGAAPSPATPSGGLRVPGLSHGGLSVEFECLKPDPMNIQKSVLIAHFSNTTDAPIHGMNLQVAVPKYISMQMQPPSSTSIPVGMSTGVTQQVTVNNSMVGSKNLVLKVKLGFTANGQAMQHMATVSGFPAGQY